MVQLIRMDTVNPTTSSSRLHHRLLRWVQRHVDPLSRILSAQPRPRSPAQRYRDWTVALLWGGICHALFAVAVISMIAAMWFGMSRSLGSLTAPWSWIMNVVLLLQFPLLHSALLSRPGRRFLGRCAPADTGPTLSTTTFAVIASGQLILLFVLWSPSGTLWWQADGWSLWVMGALYTCAWGLLIKASWDAGAEVQSGLLGWLSLLRGIKPPFPPMPETGLFRLIRQPIYVSFALTTWTVPVWTPDQLLLASVLTLYCLIGPMAKERRFAQTFARRWDDYQRRTPYWVPLPRRR